MAHQANTPPAPPSIRARRPTPAPDLQPVLGREAEVIAAGVPPASVRSPILHNVAATIAAPIG